MPNFQHWNPILSECLSLSCFPPLGSAGPPATPKKLATGRALWPCRVASALGVCTGLGGGSVNGNCRLSARDALGLQIEQALMALPSPEIKSRALQFDARFIRTFQVAVNI